VIFWPWLPHYVIHQCDINITITFSLWKSAEEVPKQETEVQEEEKKIEPIQETEDEDLPPLDSSEEEDSDEPNEYQEDGFVVNSESDEDLPDVEADAETRREGAGLRRLRKGGKRKRLELDQEDLDLIAFSKGLEPSTKLKKMTADSADPFAPSSISVAKQSATRTFSLFQSPLSHGHLFNCFAIFPMSIVLASHF
jgi:hypothetical protein